MNVKIFSSPVSGIISIPPSKSLTHRYFILASLANGTSIIHNSLMCDDTRHTLKALEKLGIKIERKNSDVIIKGNSGSYLPLEKTIFLGDSGTSSRLFIGLATLTCSSLVVDGSPRLRERPNRDLFNALVSQGIAIKYLNLPNHLPVLIENKKINGGIINVSGSVSSQFISSLMMVAPFAKKNTTIEIKDVLKSKPYVDLTIQSMKKFGVEVQNNKYNSFTIKNHQQFVSTELSVEGDYSSASYFIVLSFLTGTPITIDNLNKDSLQADKKILTFVKKLGGIIEWRNNSLIIKRKEKIKSGEFDVSDCPDIALTLGVMGPFTDNFLFLKGIKNLRHKESDRGQALVSNLRTLGARIETGEDYVKIFRSKLHGGTIKSFNDHRVAMSFGILGSVVPGIVIQNSEVVSKSYPRFFDDLKLLGIHI